MLKELHLPGRSWWVFIPYNGERVALRMSPPRWPGGQHWAEKQLHKALGYDSLRTFSPGTLTLRGQVELFLSL